MVTRDQLVKLLKEEHNPNVWGSNNCPSADELIEILSHFSIIEIDIIVDTLFITFSHQIFTLEDMIKLLELRPDEIDVVSKNKLRIWWD